MITFFFFSFTVKPQVSHSTYSPLTQLLTTSIPTLFFFSFLKNMNHQLSFLVSQPVRLRSCRNTSDPSGAVSQLILLLNDICVCVCVTCIVSDEQPTTHTYTQTKQHLELRYINLRRYFYILTEPRASLL